MTPKFSVGAKVKIPAKIAFQTNQVENGVYEVAEVSEDELGDHQGPIYTVKCADGQMLRWLDTKYEVPVGLQEDEIEAA